MANNDIQKLLETIVANILLNEKLELVNWDEYMRLVADAYEKAPNHEPEAEASFGVMKQAVLKFYNMILSKVKVEFVDGDPYQSAEQMKKEVKETKVLKIMKDHSDHPFFSPEENWKFRAVHDWFTHIISGQPFTLKGELAAYNTHAKMFPPAALPALFTEIVGQVSYNTVKGTFPVQKVVLLKGFDYKNLGRVDGRLVVNKKLQPSGVEV